MTKEYIILKENIFPDTAGKAVYENQAIGVNLDTTFRQIDSFLQDATHLRIFPIKKIGEQNDGNK